MSTTKKRKLTVALSILLVAAVALGVTLAYLFSRTDTKENAFTFAENIKGYLSEPSWNPDEAQNLVPGKEIAKDPQIKNTSENGVEEYAAIKLTFLNGAGAELSDSDTAKLLSLIDIDWSGNWTLKNGTAASAKQIYVYNSAIPQGVTSDPVFYSVTIKDTIAPAEFLWLAGDYGHEDSCYSSGTHDSAVCTITYWHHEKCAIYGMAGAENIAKGGTLNSKTCDCNATQVHESGCPALIKTLTGTCSHNTIVSGLGNFTIKVEGAVVQADAFDNFNDAVAALTSLF